MKRLSIFTALLALAVSVMSEGITRYITNTPAGAIVLQDRQALNDMVRNNPETILTPENGGYYLKTLEDEVLAIAGSDLYVELDAAVACVESLARSSDNEAGKEENTK